MEKNLSLILTIFFVHCLLIQSLETADQEVLLALKAHITYDPSNFLTNNWNTTSSVCDWMGVTCDINQHKVTALDVSYLSLIGTIPSQLGNLSSLQSLDLSFNQLSGTIPSTIFTIASLKFLDLSDNQLSGSFPSFIFNMSTLQVLDFNNNRLSEKLPANICDNLPFLESLNLRGNMFHGEIPSTLSNCKRLGSLSLSMNDFSGTIPKEIGNLMKLKKLYLGYNKLQGIIPSQLGNLSSLQTLNLGKNQFFGSIPSSIFNISSLKALNLSHNQLSGSFPAFIYNLSSILLIDFTNNRLSDELPANICEYLPSLEFLSLSLNKFHGEIPSTLSNCKRLQNLSLSDNDFSGAIPKEIGNWTKLKEIYLDYNKLQGEIPREIGNLVELQTLELSDNFLTGRIPRDIGNLTSVTWFSLSFNKLIGKIPYEIGNLQNLESLGLNNNRLVGLLPATFFNLSTIIQVALTNNTLSGSLPPSSNIEVGLRNLETLLLGINNFSGTFPDFIINASKLSDLELGINSFSGNIPRELGNLRNLERFGIGENYFTSSTPDLNFLSSLTNCKNLQTIEASRNPLNGILPSSIGNLSISMENFFLFHCNISGRIPEEIGNLVNLISLSLGENKLTGSIPVTLGRLQKLQGLDLQFNRLKGPIPVDICHLARMSDLILRGNNFSGSIPGCLGNITALRTLYLNSNRLTSVIPSTLWNLKDIQYVDFSSNSLNGRLPLDIENLKVVIEIDFSMNNLSGNIPTTIGALENLQYLLLDHNRLQGSIPESFGNLKSLLSLDLSSNNLSRAIPKSLEKLSTLEYLNLSFNRLKGEIPRGGSFAKFLAESFVGNDLLCGSLLLQVPPCKRSKNGTHKKLRKFILVLEIVLPLSIAFLIVVIVALIRQKRRIKLPSDVNMSPPATWTRFSQLELSRATDGFSENNLIGIGSFGSVYKARLRDGMEFAIKVFHLKCRGALKSFDVECEIMKSIRHRNLVKVISSCSNDNFKALVLEYMPNGSLENRLHSDICNLDVFQRLNILIDVASALEYLHFGHLAPIVHCDLKPSNVLLDKNMVAHLSDFGIAKLLTGGDEMMMRTQTLATIGYMAPEYGREGQVSTKGDIYSYGILVMEMFTRKKPTDQFFSEEMSLKSWVCDLLPKSVVEVADTNLLRRDLEVEDFAAKEQCMSSVLNLAIECTRESPGKRIDTKEVLARLLKIRDTLLRNVEGRSSSSGRPVLAST